MIEIKYIDTNVLQSHERNPRKIDFEQFEALKKSIIDNPDFFSVRPILATPDMVVFAGNMRLRAAIELKLDQVPVAIMDIPLERQRELMIRDNVANGVWDHDILSADFGVEELKGWGYDAVATGFDAKTPAAGGAATDENQKWEIECPDCHTTHIFSKSDLKPYEG